MDAWALTDHGHANGYAHAFLHSKKLNSGGQKFKFIGGVEAYYHPDLDMWREDYEIAKQARLDAKALKKAKDAEDKDLTSGNAEDESMTIENEDATKDVSKWFNPVNRRHHLVLLPKTRRGLENIFTLISKSYKEGFFKFPRIDRKMLKEHGEDVIASTACIGGPVSWAIFHEFKEVARDELTAHLLDDPRAMDRAVNRVGNVLDELIDALGKENVFPEIQFNKLPTQHLVNRAIMEFCRRNGMKLIATADSHYCRPEFWKAREMYKKLGWLGYENITPESLPKGIEELKCELYPKNAEQMWSAFKEYCADYPWYDAAMVREAIENTWHIAHDVIGDVKPDMSLKLPSYVVPTNLDPFTYLLDAVKEALRVRGLDKKPEYVARAKRELAVIKKKNFELYFLTMKAIFDVASKVCLVGPARGSAGGSLVNYLLGITQIDPIQHDLLFERFLTEQRAEPPDIDSDLADRDLVINGLREKFGVHNVIPVSNYNSLQLKSLTKDISKFYGIPFEEATAGVSTVEADVRAATMGAGDDKNLFVLTYDDALKHSTKYREYLEKYPQVAENISVLYKQVRSIGRHAGGVLISENIERHLPVITVKGEPQTPWVEGTNVKHLNEFGHCKFDLLGLETLRFIHGAIEHILRRHHGIAHPTFDDVSKWFNENMHPDRLDLNDLHVYETVYQPGRFVATFQYTSQGAQRFIKRFKPTCLEDIAIATSIYRPGPLAAKVDELYMEALRDPEKAERETHPLVWQALKSTKGLIVFQEQLMQLAQIVAGFSPEDSERVRKTILKQSITAKGANKEKRAQIRAEFCDGCVSHAKMPRKDAEALFDKIEFFCGYGFNRSHAVAYAIDSYYCAWLQTYYEAEWCCAYLEAVSNNADKLARAIQDVKALGYKLKKLDINIASHNWTIVDDEKAFIPSFYSCKGIGAAAIDEILETRPYKTGVDLLWDKDGVWKHSKFNKRALESLIRIGAFDSMDIVGPGKEFTSYKHMHEVIIENIEELRKTPKKEPLYGMMKYVELKDELKDIDDWTRLEKIEAIKELTGDISAHNIIPDHVSDALAKRDIPAVDELDENLKEKRLAWFIVDEVTIKKTKNGKSYQLLRGFGIGSKRFKIFSWGFDPNKSAPAEKFDLYVAELEKSEFGFATTSWKIKKIEVD